MDSVPLREICTHVVNHSTHHRAQVARLIRKAGGVPPATDYIFYARSPEHRPRNDSTRNEGSLERRPSS